MSGRDFRFLIRPRWFFGALTIAAMAVVMVNLGLWQLRRLHQRQQSNAAIESRMQAPAATLASVLARYDVHAPLTDATSVAYRHVTVSGRYDAAAEVLLRSRSEGGHPGFHVLTPLELADGRALLVDRGWVPYTDDEPPLAVAAPPSGEMTVTGLMRLSEPEPSGMFTTISPQDPATGPLTKSFYANPQRLQAQFPYRLVDAYLQLVTQQPPQSGELPVPPDAPVLTDGPHLSYAIQWFSFTAIAVIGFGVVLERRARLGPEDDES